MSSADATSVSPIKRTARLKKHGDKYTLLLLINGESVETRITESPQDQTFDKGFEWRDDDGFFAIPGATFSMVTEGSTFVFQGNRYPVEDQTPFEEPPANGENCLDLVRVLIFDLFKLSFANN